MPDNEARLKNIMAQVFDIPTEQINESSALGLLDEWDSLNHIKLIVSLEEEFQVTFSDEQTVEMLDYIQIRSALKACDVPFE